MRTASVLGRSGAGRLGRLLAAAVLAALLAASPWCGPARAAGEKAEPVPAGPAAKLEMLDRLLADPELRALLTGRVEAGGMVEAPARTAPPPTMAISLGDRLQGYRQHLIALGGALGTLPGEAFAARSMVAVALDQRGWAAVALLFVTFVALGFGTETLFRWAMRPAQRWLLALKLDSVSERVRAVFHRSAYGFGMTASFTLGSVGGFLLFDWPPLLKEIVLGYLIAFLLARLFAVAGRVLLAPGAQRFRVVPLTTPGAAFLFRRWIALAALIGFSWQTISLASRFGMAPLSAELCGDVVAVLVLLVGLDIVWRMPKALLADVEDAGTAFVGRHHRGVAFARSAALLLLWLLWLAEAYHLFWLLAFAGALPLVIVAARRSVNHILRPAELAAAPADKQPLDVVIFERGVRFAILVTAALALARILDVDIVSLTMADTLTTRIVRAVISIAVIGLAADFVWHVLKALIDRRIAASFARVDGEDAGHAARLQTLLPIIGNMLAVVIVVVAGMMMLASTGIEIGPLVASAGVVGVAIGFGAQTLVKDIISGIFYLFDDAFRIGEYIQSGSYKGTVESFSLRSIKLRHQRGALYTVPFGILGAVQNQSRDWVVDKIVLNVPYGTDLDRVRKLIKRIGETLAEDEDFAADIINPLKMQGVVQFGDFAIQIQTKMMTKPGDVQFLARRRALLMINKAFTDNGIGFATPVVQVAGGADAAVAAAQSTLDLMRTAKPT